MKVSKKVWLIVIIGVFAIVLGSLYALYFREAEEREELSLRLLQAEVLLPGLTATTEELEDRLAQATSLLNTNQAEFPESVESIEYGEDLFEIADDCNLDLIELRPSKPTNKKVGAVTYSVSSFTVIVKGDIDDVIDFIYAIRTGNDFQLPWSTDLNRVNMSIVSGGMTQATIDLTIYGYKR